MKIGHLLIAGVFLAGLCAPGAATAQPGYGWPATPGWAPAWHGYPAWNLPPGTGWARHPRALGPGPWRDDGATAGTEGLTCCSPGLEWREVYPGYFSCVPNPACT